MQGQVTLSKTEEAFQDKWLVPLDGKCKCGWQVTIWNQPDRNPKYYSIIGISCPYCPTERIYFKLAVN